MIFPGINPASLSNGASSSTTVATTFPSNTKGNLIITGIGWADPTGTITCTVADSAGNTYTSTGARVRNATQQYSFQMFYAWGIAASSGTNTVTGTISTSQPFMDIHMQEIGSSYGPWLFDPLDAAAVTGTGNSTALATASISPTRPNTLLCVFGGASSGVITANANWTLRASGANAIGMADKRQGAIVSEAGVLTTSVSSQWGITGSAFRDAIRTSLVVEQQALQRASYW